MPATPQSFPAGKGPSRTGRRARLLAAGSAALVAMVTTAVALTSYSAGAATGAGPHDPVIMIPGMTGSPSNMDTMKSDLQSNGWAANRLFTWTDSSSMEQDLAKAAQELGAEVDHVRAQTGAAKVVLATWSASTLAARYYLKNLGGADKVSQYVGYAGPQHGTTNNACQFYVSCQQFGDANSPFLTALNSGTEVPGHPQVAYLTIRSVRDANATPYDTAKLEGADENFLLSGPNAPIHFTIISDGTALAEMRSFIIAHEHPTTGTPTPTSGTTPPPTTTTPPAGQCFTASNYAHVTAGRAHDSFGYALANGSDQNLGIDSLYGTTKLRRTGANYYVLDPTCP
ncbi:esterase/lipase family protein [Amycolatopsis sp. cmx-4-68]|uniref:esterase/lipase family protein n=1 Tax=Amycolatopsis sp. cmx-4-68 TaxID=2790938 RepID=UPI00397DBC93